MTGEPKRSGIGFGNRVVRATSRFGPICAGIDPSGALLAAWDLPDDSSGLRAFGFRCLEAFAGTVGIVKPQVAFFERHGAAGIAALEELLRRRPRRLGIMVLADAKRGDVDSTSEAYADAWLGPFEPAGRRRGDGPPLHGHRRRSNR